MELLIAVLFWSCAFSRVAGVLPSLGLADYSTFSAPQRNDLSTVQQQIRHWELLYQTRNSWDPDRAGAAVQELVRLGNCGRSIYGKKHRSLICTIVRNDLHLREFLIRHLLQGFCHIVVYDNNQIEVGIDHSIRVLLDPFVAAGVVTHVPYLQNNGQLLHNDQKDEHVLECVEIYGSQADWVAVMDSDEYFYIAKQSPPAYSLNSNSSSGFGPCGMSVSGSNSSTDGCQLSSSTHSPSSSSSSSSSSVVSIGTLDSFLTDLENSGLHACSLEFPWKMVYGEHRVLRSQQLLLDTYNHTVCGPHRLAKSLFKPGAAFPLPPHYAQCMFEHERRISVDSELFQQSLSQYSVHLLHYYSRSIEEYLKKSDQSMLPVLRRLRHSYDTIINCKLFELDQPYKVAVRDSMQQLYSAQAGLGTGGIKLSRLPELPLSSRPDHALYDFFKQRVQQQHEWDESAYVLRNPEVAELIRQGVIVDGLQHFLFVGFDQGVASCWVDKLTASSFCLEGNEL